MKKIIILMSSFLLLSFMIAAPESAFASCKKEKRIKCCKRQYGYFYTMFTSDSDTPVPQNTPIPFDLEGIHSNCVNLVIDNTFDLGSKAIAISKPGIYQLTFGASNNSQFGSYVDIVPRINSVDLSYGKVSAGLDSVSSVTIYIEITKDQVKNGQNGAALVKIMADDNPLYLGVSSADDDDVTAFITLLLVDPS